MEGRQCQKIGGRNPACQIQGIQVAANLAVACDNDCLVGGRQEDLRNTVLAIRSGYSKIGLCFAGLCFAKYIVLTRTPIEIAGTIYFKRVGDSF